MTTTGNAALGVRLRHVALLAALGRRRASRSQSWSRSGSRSRSRSPASWLSTPGTTPRGAVGPILGQLFSRAEAEQGGESRPGASQVQPSLAAPAGPFDTNTSRRVFLAVTASLASASA